MQTIEAHSIFRNKRYVFFLCCRFFLFSFSIYIFRICSYCRQVGMCFGLDAFVMAITTFISMCLTHRLYFCLKLSHYCTYIPQILSHFYVLCRRQDQTTTMSTRQTREREKMSKTSATLTTCLLCFSHSLSVSSHLLRQTQAQSTKLNRKFLPLLSSIGTVWSRNRTLKKSFSSKPKK